MDKTMNVAQFIWKMTKPYRLTILGMCFAMLLVGIDSNLNSYLIKTSIDRVSLADFAFLKWVLLIYAIKQLVIVFAWWFFDYCQFRYAPQMTSYIARELVGKISNYSYRFFQDTLAGSISTKISDAAKKTPDLLNTLIVEVLALVVMMVVAFFLLSTVHYGFTIAIICWISFFIAFTIIGLRKAQVLSQNEAEVNSHVWGRVVDYFTNIFAIKIFTSQAYEQQRLNNDLQQYINKARARGLYIRNFFSCQGIVYSIYILGCLYAMITLSEHKLITPGDFALVFMINFSIVDHLFHLAFTLNMMINDYGAVSQALSIVDQVPDVQDQANAQALQISQAQIEFDQVHFNYPGTEPLFENKSVIIKPGTKVGLVGYSGGGKTTFVNLILRMFDVKEGQILIDGQDIRQVTQESLRSVIGMIPQDPTLFHRSLLENIRYGRLDATDEEVIIAAKQAACHNFISALPEQYNTLVGERGIKLSGGQRQRIAIARAILKNAPILILDEATSQLDSLTEREIQTALWTLMQNKTTIVIAHRLSTLMHMDRILVFEKGKIVQDGNHEQLLAQGGLYQVLWNTQVDGFIKE